MFMLCVWLSIDLSELIYQNQKMGIFNDLAIIKKALSISFLIFTLGVPGLLPFLGIKKCIFKVLVCGVSGEKGTTFILT